MRAHKLIAEGTKPEGKHSPAPFATILTSLFLDSRRRRRAVPHASCRTQVLPVGASLHPCNPTPKCQCCNYESADPGKALQAGSQHPYTCRRYKEANRATSICDSGREYAFVTAGHVAVTAPSPQSAPAIADVPAHSHSATRLQQLHPSILISSARWPCTKATSRAFSC